MLGLRSGLVKAKLLNSWVSSLTKSSWSMRTSCWAIALDRTCKMLMGFILMLVGICSTTLSVARCLDVALGGRVDSGPTGASRVICRSCREEREDRWPPRGWI